MALKESILVKFNENLIILHAVHEYSGESNISKT